MIEAASLNRIETSLPFAVAPLTLQDPYAVLETLPAIFPFLVLNCDPCRDRLLRNGLPVRLHLRDPPS